MGNSPMASLSVMCYNFLFPLVLLVILLITLTNYIGILLSEQTIIKSPYKYAYQSLILLHSITFFYLPMCY